MSALSPLTTSHVRRSCAAGSRRAWHATLTFTEEVSYRDNLELVSRLGRPGLLAAPVNELAKRGAEAVAYLCTACSFADGVAGERALREAMRGHGARQALTTSGAVTGALRAVGARRLAVVHPLPGGRSTACWPRTLKAPASTSWPSRRWASMRSRTSTP